MALVVDIETVGVDPEEIPPRALTTCFEAWRDGADEREIEAWKEMIERFSPILPTGRIVCIGVVDTRRARRRFTAGKRRSFSCRSEAPSPEEARLSHSTARASISFISICSAILEVPPSLPLPMHP
jgi:hypothetical protein